MRNFLEIWRDMRNSLLEAQLDALDTKLLTLLQKDCMLTNAELGAEVGLSTSSCAKRVARLRRSGVISKMVALVDRRKIQKHVMAVVTINMSAPKTDYLQTFTNRLNAMPEVQQCYAIAGENDFVAIVAAASIEDYHDFAQGAFGSEPIVQAYRTSFILETAKYETAVPLGA